VKLVEQLGIPELTTEQIEELCIAAENAARKFVLAKVSSKMVERLNISVEANGAKPVNLTVEIDMALATQMKDFALDRLVREAVRDALKASENYLRKLL
jgi:DNA-binding protein YbaB